MTLKSVLRATKNARERPKSATRAKKELNISHLICTPYFQRFLDLYPCFVTKVDLYRVKTRVQIKKMAQNEGTDQPVYQLICTPPLNKSRVQIRKSKKKQGTDQFL